MKIAYIAGYQGPELIKKRTVIKNRALAGTRKIGMVITALSKAGHDVTVLSHGIDANNNFRYSKSFSEEIENNVFITYASSFGCKGLNVLFALSSLFFLFKKVHKNNKIDIVILYNLALPEVFVGIYANFLKIPIILEYEDSAFVSRYGKVDLKSFFRRTYLSFVINKLSGCFAPSPELLSEIGSNNSYLLRGVVGNSLLEKINNSAIKKENIVLFAGSHNKSKGLDLLLKGWVLEKIPGWELHICGYGALTEELKEKYKDNLDIVFHGFVSNQILSELLVKAKICINPHRESANVGNVFPFKLIEYIVSGSHVISSRMGKFEKEFESVITYLPDLSPDNINNTIKEVISRELLVNIETQKYVINKYCLRTVGKELNEIISNSIK